MQQINRIIISNPPVNGSSFVPMGSLIKVKPFKYIQIFYLNFLTQETHFQYENGSSLQRLYLKYISKYDFAFQGLLNETTFTVDKEDSSFFYNFNYILAFQFHFIQNFIHAG